LLPRDDERRLSTTLREIALRPCRRDANNAFARFVAIANAQGRNWVLALRAAGGIE
jgi:hypothetical protein